MDTAKYQSQSDFKLNAAPQDRLANLVTYAQVKGGHLEPGEVLALAAAAKDAIESLFSDIEQANREALQEAVFETFLVKGNT